MVPYLRKENPETFTVSGGEANKRTMPECRRCSESVSETMNFCPHCGVPQNQQALEQFDEYAKRRIKQLEAAGEIKTSNYSSSVTLLDRISYVIGWLGIVGGLAFLPNIGAVLTLIGGLAVLPPLRRLIEHLLDRPIDARPIMGTSVLCILVGLASIWIL